MSDKVDTSAFKNARRLRDLRIEHRDLDDLIRMLELQPTSDRMQVQRLKKRKLRLKDTIAKVESRLIPDLGA